MGQALDTKLNILLLSLLILIQPNELVLLVSQFNKEETESD